MTHGMVLDARRCEAEGPRGERMRGWRFGFPAASASHGIAILGVADRQRGEGLAARVVLAIDGAETWMTPNAARRLVRYIETAIAAAEREERGR